MTTKTTKALAEFVVETSIKEFPSDTIEHAKILLLKCLTGMLVGSMEPVSQKMIRYLRAKGDYPEAGVISAGFRTSVENAVLALGTFPHATEFEDVTFPAGVSTITVVPVALSLGEKLRVSGKEVLEAFVLGYEVQTKVAKACAPHASARGIQTLSFFGALGAAAAAAKLLDLSVDQTVTALSLAASHAGGVRLQHGTAAHFVEAGFACQGGVLGALLAREGVTAHPEVLENPLGFLLRLGEGNCDLKRMTADLGRPFEIHTVWVKKYPCCFWAHCGIDALLELVKEHKLSYHDIETVEVETVEDQAQICDRPDPADAEASKFSFQHMLGAVLLENKVDSETFSDTKVNEPQFREARSKVRVKGRTGPFAFLPGETVLTVTMKNGQRLSKTKSRPLGAPDAPLTQDEIVALFRNYAKVVLAEPQARRVIELILDLAKLGDVTELMDIVTFRGRSITQRG